MDANPVAAGRLAPDGFTSLRERRKEPTAIGQRLLVEPMRASR
jgi:hypothetical protein